MGKEDFIEKVNSHKQGVVFAIIKDDKILLEERIEAGSKFSGYTIIPGGGAGDESIEKALEREVDEEFGSKVVEYILLKTITKIEDDVTNTRHLFLVTEVSGEISNPEGINKHIWATLEDAYKICKHPLTLEFLDIIAESLNDLPRQD